jgi:hypothetical protein
MASEISLDAAFTLYKPSIMPEAVSYNLVAQLFTMTGLSWIGPTSMLVPFASATVIPLGGVTAPHMCFVVNMDPTNYVDLFNGSSGTHTIRLYPGQSGAPNGEFALFPWVDTAVPYAQANTAAVQIVYFIASK